MLFFSASSCGFYDTEIHDNIPEDARELTRERHAELMVGQASGKRIVPDENGDPVLAAPAEPTAENLAAAARRERAVLLDAADKAINTLEDNGGDTAAWRKYRQALRDVPAQAGFPNSIDWPAAPG